MKDSRPSWDNYFMSMLPLIASRSLDPNTKVGCIIVGQDNQILSTGYNSFCRGMDDFGHPERLERPEKYFWCEHAERSGIYQAAKKGIPLEGSKLYVCGYPCMDCARGIVQVGIKSVIYDKINQEKWAQTTPKYGPDFKRTEMLFEECGVQLIPWINPNGQE